MKRGAVEAIWTATDEHPGPKMPTMVLSVRSSVREGEGRIEGEG